jgi:hypothetical protein
MRQTEVAPRVVGSIATTTPHDARASSRALVSFRSSVSKPSVNQS